MGKSRRKRAKQTNMTTTPGTSGGNFYGSKCVHLGKDPIYIHGKKQITGASRSGLWVYRPDNKLIIDLASNLAYGTSRNFIRQDSDPKFKSLEKFVQGSPEVLRLDWPDGGTPPVGLAFWKHLWTLLPDGRTTFTCEGGHGRTGTAIAAMMVANGVAPYDATELVRHILCYECVETKSQETYIYDLGEEAGLAREDGSYIKYLEKHPRKAAPTPPKGQPTTGTPTGTTTSGKPGGFVLERCLACGWVTRSEDNSCINSKCANYHIRGIGVVIGYEDWRKQYGGFGGTEANKPKPQFPPDASTGTESKFVQVKNEDGNILLLPKDRVSESVAPPKGEDSQVGLDGDGVPFCTSCLHDWDGHSFGAGCCERLSHGDNIATVVFCDCPLFQYRSGDVGSVEHMTEDELVVGDLTDAQRIRAIESLESIYA